MAAIAKFFGCCSQPPVVGEAVIGEKGPIDDGKQEAPRSMRQLCADIQALTDKILGNRIEFFRLRKAYRTYRLEREQYHNKDFSEQFKYLLDKLYAFYDLREAQKKQIAIYKKEYDALAAAPGNEELHFIANLFKTNDQVDVFVKADNGRYVDSEGRSMRDREGSPIEVTKRIHWLPFLEEEFLRGMNDPPKPRIPKQIPTTFPASSLSAPS